MTDSDLAELRKQCITSLYLCTANVSKYLDSEKNEEFDKLKSYVEEYCKQEAQEDVAKQALDKAKRETNSRNIDSFEDRFKAYLESMTGKRLNVNNHLYMKEFNNITGKALREEIQNLNNSDIAAISEAQNQYIDPITKRPIVDPVKNRVCGHVYEKEAILELIKMSERNKCPVAGCFNIDFITEEDLILDQELRFRMTINTHSTMIEEGPITNLDDSQ